MSRATFSAITTVINVDVVANVNFCLSRALKDQGYQSDSTLVFKKRSDVDQLSPVDQKLVYKSFQHGGEVPLHGFRKPLPEKPKGECEIPCKKQSINFVQKKHSFTQIHTDIRSHTYTQTYKKTQKFNHFLEVENP